MWTPLISCNKASNAGKGSWGNFVLEKEGAIIWNVVYNISHTTLDQQRGLDWCCCVSCSSWTRCYHQEAFLSRALRMRPMALRSSCAAMFMGALDRFRDASPADMLWHEHWRLRDQTAFAEFHAICSQAARASATSEKAARASATSEKVARASATSEKAARAQRWSLSQERRGI